MATLTVPKVNLTIPQGETYKHRFWWVDEQNNAVDTTPYTGARMQIRQEIESDTIEATLTVGSGITLGGANGAIDISIPAATTAGWAWTSGVYDIEMVIPGTPEDVTRAVQGRIRVTPEVTR